MNEEACPKCSSKVTKVYKEGKLVWVLCQSLVCDYMVKLE